MNEKITILDTTLRDGEQTRGVSFSSEEKLSLTKMLIKEAKIDRVEVASAKVSEGEKETVSAICAWAKTEGVLARIEVLGFVDKDKSVDWLCESGCTVLNLLAKGSKKHCEKQLRKKPEEHYADVKEVIDYADSKGVVVNVYFEDWSNGMKDSEDYVLDFARFLSKTKVNRLMLPDTLGVLEPTQVFEYVKKMKEVFPVSRMDFHAHNDYGLATANSLAAIREGITTVHCTVNGLGERTGNAPLAELVAVINDKTLHKTNVDESSLVRVSKFVERISGKKLPTNKPIVGEDVFTQTAGIHADGDAKGGLYANPLFPERFGRKREYALGKLSGKASLEQNLKELKVELTQEQKKLVLERVVSLGDRKETVTAEDLPYIISDVLKTPLERRVQILSCEVKSSLSGKPSAKLKIKFNGVAIEESSRGDGGYDAFMTALAKAAKKKGITIPKLTDYEVRIPPGGKTDALVETTITWNIDGKEYRTVGIDSDQVMAAIKATEKMLNHITAQE
ncbi:MAG: 2-isopropylmalate synthase [archaeon]|nr:2-isopropylmalate synthase [archaeon]